jgi:hypothetical protein
MATTTNYGWAEPDNTSLVRNGAQDIRILGDAIDASVWNIGFGQAGKNKIINGDFGIWQRGTSFSYAAASDAYQSDRWKVWLNGTTSFTVSRQTFTPATAPVAGYEGTYFHRIAVTSQSGGTIASTYQKIEDVRTFAGQTVTVSFWAKHDTARTLGTRLIQNFGSGGSADVTVSVLTSVATTTGWVRYSGSVAVPSISGKTIGTGSSLWLLIDGPTNVAQTLDIWGVQLEAGSKATPFQTASGGSPQAELAMCQRYYWRWTASTNFATCGIGAASSTTIGVITVMHPVPMRAVVSAIDGSANSTFRLQDQVTGLTQTMASIEPSQEDLFKTDLNITVSGATQYRFYRYGANNSTSAYLGFSAEL